MSTGIYSIGIGGMQAAQLGLTTTEHNISNATTPGYNRQRTIQAANVPIMSGAGAIGQGTHVQTVSRMYSQFITTQVNRAQANVSELDAYYREISQIDNMLADVNSGLSPALQDFFRGVQQVTAYPASLSSRQSMISSAEAMVARYQGLEGRLNELADGVNSQVGSMIANINSYAKQIAELNDRIVIAQSAVQQPANDLLDQRDQLVSELNKLVKVTVSVDSVGAYNIFAGTGQQLVVGNRARELAAIPAAADPSRIIVGIKSAGNIVQELPENLITGGELGGLLRFRAESLDVAFNQLGRVAATMALTFNAQNALGQDLLGQANGEGNFQANFFNIPAPAVQKNSANTGNAILQASFVSPPPIEGHYALRNTGAGYVLTRLSDGQQWNGANLAALQATIPPAEGITVSAATVAAGNTVQLAGAKAQEANFYTRLTDSDYRLSYDGANYTLTRLSDNQKWTNASLPALSTTVSNAEGFSFTLASGAMGANDSFIIRPTREVARNLTVNPTVVNDPRLVAAAMPVRAAAGTTNVGDAKMADVRTVAGFSAAATPMPFTLTYNSATGMLSGFPAGANVAVTVGTSTTVHSAGTVPYSPATGAKITVNGIAFTLSGTPGNGDTFVVERNAGGTSDGRNILALGKLQSQKTLAGGTATYQEGYAQLVSDNGNKTRQIEVTGKAQVALLEQATNSREALSGVNLDEEAANLIRFQQAYQASAKMLEIGSKLFETILSLRT